MTSKTIFFRVSCGIDRIEKSSDTSIWRVATIRSIMGNIIEQKSAIMLKS